MRPRYGAETKMANPLRDLLGSALQNVAREVETKALPNILAQALAKTNLGSLI
jgi:hypothetical protein